MEMMMITITITRSLGSHPSSLSTKHLPTNVVTHWFLALFRTWEPHIITFYQPNHLPTNVVTHRFLPLFRTWKPVVRHWFLPLFRTWQPVVTHRFLPLFRTWHSMMLSLIGFRSFYTWLSMLICIRC